MIKKLLLTSIFVLCCLPNVSDARQLIRGGNFNRTKYWTMSGHCSSKPANCVYTSTAQDQAHIGAVSQYLRFGKKNETEYIAQVVKLKKHKRKLHLRLKLKLTHTSRSHYQNDSFSIIITGKEFGHSWRKDLTYRPTRPGWRTLDYNLKDIVQLNKGKNIVVSFFLDNDNMGVTKAQLTKVQLKQYN